MRKFALCLLVLLAQGAFAARKLSDIPFFWHDWYRFVGGAPSPGLKDGIARCIDVIITNPSPTVTQNVTVKVTTVPYLMVAVYGDGTTVQTGTIPANNVHGFVPTTSTPTTISYTNTLHPHDTAWYPYCAEFHHNPLELSGG